MKKQRVYIFINGIMNFPGNSHGWNYRAAVAVQLGNHGHAMPVEYLCGPIDRAFGQKKRAMKVLELIQVFNGWDIILVGHSNGCAVILKALGLAEIYPTIESIHFVSGACEADFRWNGINEAVENGKVGKVYVYVAGQDKALRLASRWFGRLLGYGVLGLHGARNVSEGAKNAVGEMTCQDYGHSTWWEPEHFDRTMSHFLATP